MMSGIAGVIDATPVVVANGVVVAPVGVVVLTADVVADFRIN